MSFLYVAVSAKPSSIIYIVFHFGNKSTKYLKPKMEKAKENKSMNSMQKKEGKKSDRESVFARQKNNIEITQYLKWNPSTTPKNEFFFRTRVGSVGKWSLIWMVRKAKVEKWKICAVDIDRTAAGLILWSTFSVLTAVRAATCKAITHSIRFRCE